MAAVRNFFSSANFSGDILQLCADFLAEARVARLAATVVRLVRDRRE
jgi:hypothetical protein